MKPRAAKEGVTVAITTADLKRMPWTIRGPVARRCGKERWWEIRIAELPEFLVADRTREATMNEFSGALEAFLGSYADHGELPPVPIPVLWNWLAAMTQTFTKTNSVTLNDASAWTISVGTG